MSAARTHLWQEEAIEDQGSIGIRAIVERPRHGRSELWYRIPIEFSSHITHSCDPLLVGNIFLIMSEGSDCVVHGQVSPSLLRNLAEFQAAWACWRPNTYKEVEISAESECEENADGSPDLAIAAFTGGVDSCFTMFRHRRGRLNKRLQRNLDAGLLVHGFDIPLDGEEAFQRAALRARQTLDSVGAKLITMATNLRELNIEWDDTHIAGVASCLMLLKGRYDEGLIPGSRSYSELVVPWGSNPITDHLLSSGDFRIVHDGGAVKRGQKVREISEWKEGFHNLRVCYSAERRDENCGLCIKCTMMILLLRTMRTAVPPTFPPLSDEAVSRLEVTTDQYLAGYRALVRSARKVGISDPWVEILCRRMNQQEQLMKMERSRASPLGKVLGWMQLPVKR